MKMTVYLRIEIEDEGIGVPKEEQNRIFSAFTGERTDKCSRLPAQASVSTCARDRDWA